MTDTTTPGTALVPTGVVTVCCGLHKRGDWFSCCRIEDCLPCCEQCPNCPDPVLSKGFRREADQLAYLALAVTAALYRRQS